MIPNASQKYSESDKWQKDEIPLSEGNLYLYGSIPVEAKADIALEIMSLTTRSKFLDK